MKTNKKIDLPRIRYNENQQYQQQPPPTVTLPPKYRKKILDHFKTFQHGNHHTTVYLPGNRDYDPVNLVSVDN